MKDNEKKDSLGMTWEDLLAVIQSMSPAQRQQPVQILPPNPEDYETGMHALQPVYGCETLAQLEVTASRSCLDNQHHPEAFVLMTDYNFYASDGHIATNLETGEKVFPRHIPPWPKA